MLYFNSGFTLRALSFACVALWIGCATGPSQEDATQSPAEPAPEESLSEEENPQQAESSEPSASTASVEESDDAEYYDLELGPFELDPGEERFLCFTSTVPEDVWVDKFVYEPTPAVHHLILSTSQVPEQDGVSECDVLFRITWNPLFLAGAGESNLPAPEGAGYQLTAGTQLVGQLHLLNASPDPITDSAIVRLRKTTESGLDPIKIVAFGTFNLALPPLSEGEATGQCAVEHDMKLFAAFPHMHLMGKTLTVETGPSEEELVEVFRSDPYDFDQQGVSMLDLDMSAGDQIRVHCTYDNPTDQTITFGESTLNEMCFFVGFATGPFEGIGGCMGSDGGSGFLGEGCEAGEPNDLGIGAACTRGGEECAEGLSCTSDFVDGPGMCILVGTCESAADCGNDAVCCTPAQAGGAIDICMPESCSIPGCDPK